MYSINLTTKLLSGPLPPPLTGTAATEPSLIPAAVAAPLHQSAFRPVIRSSPIIEAPSATRDLEPSEISAVNMEVDSDDEVDIETMEDEEPRTVAALGTASSDASSGINLQSSVAANSGTSSNHSGRSASPQCWSPARETVSSFPFHCIQ